MRGVIGDLDCELEEPQGRISPSFKMKAQVQAKSLIEIKDMNLIGNNLLASEPQGAGEATAFWKTLRPLDLITLKIFWDSVSK